MGEGRGPGWRQDIAGRAQFWDQIVPILRKLTSGREQKTEKEEKENYFFIFFKYYLPKRHLNFKGELKILK